jgi:RHS repeat-associated protein
MSRPTRTERRRAQLALRISSLEAMESRNLITESLGILIAGIGVPVAMMVGRAEAGVAQASPPRQPAIPADTASPVIPVSAASGATGSGGSAAPVREPIVAVAAPAVTPLAIPGANTIKVAWAVPTADSSKGGGAGGSSHGGSGSTSPATTAAPSSPAGSSSSATSAPSVVVPAVMNDPTSSTQQASPTPLATTSTTAQIPAATDPTGTSAALPGGGGFGASPDAMLSFTHFPVYTLDYNAGSVLLPGADRLATPGGDVDLRAQVANTTVSSYSWDTSGLTDATSISGTSSDDLTFQWDSTVATATTNSVTLTVTNSSSQTEVQTYTFQVPVGTGSAGTGTATWPTSLSPDTVSPGAPVIPVHNVSVDANSGSLGTAIALPTYNSNVPAVVLSYDSVTANPLPIITVPHTLDPSLAVPSQVSAQLTFNGTAGSTYYYDTSNLTPGDIQQIALQAGTAPSTGRYAYSVALGDIRGTTTTSSVGGDATVINDSGSAVGSGWVVDGLETIIPASGGVILDLGSGGKSLWFATGGGSTYVDPAGEFSTLVANMGGTYTRTLTDGTILQFNSSGREIADVDTNGVAITYGYDGLGRLSTIQDHYGNTTTFTYDGTTGLLDTITDPASRIATFTHSGTTLSGVELPDTSTWGYAYNGSSELTQVTDPDSHTVTVAYDSANRVGTISNPDATSETFTAAQEQGFVPSGSGTSLSPATATLLAQATSTFIDPLTNETDLYPDWQGLGLTDVTSDPLGNIATADRDGNGLATISIDPMNRTTQYTYDSKGNVTHTINPDGTTTSATYNSFAEPLTTTNELGYTVTYTYDGDANNTNTKQPLGVNATMTYTGTGQVTSDSNPSGDYVRPFGGPPSSGGGPISYTYDSQDRLTVQEDALSEITSYGYDSAGDRTTVTDPDNNTTTSTYDAMGRLLTTTDAMHDTTTYVYDAAGNQTVVIDPMSHRTTTTYDSMNRIASVKDADGGITSYTYDADGHEASITDSDSNVTTYAYDADGNQIGSTNPNGYASTKTYDADGDLTESVDADGHQINYGYDARGREVTESWINGTVTLETITTTYDAAGEETEVTDGTTALTFTYDQDGRQTGQGTSGSSGQPAVALTVGYYDSNERASLTDNLSSVGITSYGYDSAFRLASVATDFNSSPNQIDFAYDAAGNLTSIFRSTSHGLAIDQTPVTTSFTYDAANRVTAITDQITSLGNPPTAIDAQSYGYNASSDMTSETNAEGSVTYTYDNINELTGVSGASSATYTYDSNGNRTMSGYSTGTGNETTAGAGYTYTYDHDGNLTSKTQTSTGDVWTYTWDYRNRLTGVVEENSSHTVIMQGTYTYDPMNRRIGVDETVSAVETKTYTVYDGTNPYADFNGSGTLLERYVYGPSGQILSRTSASGTTAWYLTDHLGSVRDVVATSGTVLDHIAYDAYGNVTSETSPSNGDRFKFDGMAWDAAIGLYYDNARYYDPASGRFISFDSYGFAAGSANLSEFVGNNVTGAIDPSGHSGIKDWFKNRFKRIVGPGRVALLPSVPASSVRIVPETPPPSGPPYYTPPQTPPSEKWPLAYETDFLLTPDGILKIRSGTTIDVWKNGNTWVWGGNTPSGPINMRPIWYPKGKPNPYGDNPLTDETEELGPE